MAQSTNLKPCPFCGNEEYPPEQASRFESNMFLTKVECGNCGATMESWNDTAILDTAPNWNTRPIEDALQTRIAALSTRVAEFEAENKWLKAEYESLKAIAEEAGLIIDNANDEFRRELQSIKLQQKRGPDLDEWGRPKNEVEK